MELLNTVQRRVRPKLHVFGGIHEGKDTGMDTDRAGSLSQTCGVVRTQWFSSFVRKESFYEMKPREKCSHP